ncbi:MAG: DUF1064 domain-containing protein [Candidatus Paceibacterota bacterium]|jgi:hypothetical protein
MTNKYHARKVIIDGYTFDSLAEGNRYTELKLLAYAGEISNLEIHPYFVLFPQKYIHGKKLNAIDYTGDFRYLDGNVNVIEEVKGMMTRDAVLRINLFQRLHPEYEFRMIRTLKVNGRAKVKRKDI